MYMHMQICAYVHMYVYTHMCTYVYIRVCVHVYVYIYMYTYISYIDIYHKITLLMVIGLLFGGVGYGEGVS